MVTAPGQFGGREGDLVQRFIEAGPEALRTELKLDVDQWRNLFDHLVFNHDLLIRCVSAAGDFFLNLYVNEGMTRVKEILSVMDERYDEAFEDVFDYLAVQRGGLYRHVLNFKERYAQALKKHDAEFVKKILCLSSERYEQQWANVLDLLLTAFCENVNAETHLDHSLRAFSHLANDTRMHRKPFGSGFFLS